LKIKYPKRKVDIVDKIRYKGVVVAMDKSIKKCKLQVGDYFLSFYYQDNYKEIIQDSLSREAEITVIRTIERHYNVYK